MDDQASELLWNGQIHVLSPLTKSLAETNAALERERTAAATGATRNEVNRSGSRDNLATQPGLDGANCGIGRPFREDIQ